MANAADGITVIKVTVEGRSPLLMHNPRLADPGDGWTKQIKEITKLSSKKRTDEHVMRLRECEYMGGLYIDEVLGPYVPDSWVEGVIREGAKKVERGLASTIIAGLTCEEQMMPLQYNGPRDAKSLYESNQFFDSRIVVVNNARVVRIRPRFNLPWSFNCTLLIYKDLLNVDQVQKSFTAGGMYKGVGDYTPKFGRYSLSSFEVLG
jgi:hypothetical protein